MAVSRRQFLTTAVGAALVASCSRTNGQGAASAPSTSGAGAGAPSAGSGSASSTSLPPLPSAPSSLATTTTGDFVGAARHVSNGSRRRPEVALTFTTTGDRAVTEDLGVALAELGVPATFFYVGEWVTANPGVAKALSDAGHDAGNQTWSGLPLDGLSPDALTAEIVQGRDALVRELAEIGTWFRSPGPQTPIPAALVAAGGAGYAFSVGWDIDLVDLDEPGTDALVSAVASQVRPGSIIRLDSGSAGTVDALGPIVDVVINAGLSAETLSTLLR